MGCSSSPFSLDLTASLEMWQTPKQSSLYSKKEPTLVLGKSYRGGGTQPSEHF
ncbi:hypothetical protein O178_01935 [Chlamydia trachomatis]|nr:hypothetical protein O178_01935 [Chlamydia trachomatis]